MNNFQDITIKHMDNGLKVKVGCIRLVYQQKDLKQFFKDLGAYFENPEKTEKAIRKRWGMGEANPTCTTTWTTFNLAPVTNEGD